MLFGLVIQPDFYSNTYIQDDNRNEISDIQDIINPDSLNTYDTHSLASDIASGILDPVLAEQSGWYDTGGISARTDAHINDFTDIPIDNESNWVASNAKMELWNLNREYAENGTFDEGIGGNQTYPDSITSYPYGWDVDWYDSSGGLQTLMTYYDNSSNYVTVESQGEEDTTPSLTYWHYDYTWNLWNQTITNQPNSDNMTLSFSYNYVSGVVNNLYEVGGDIGLAAWIENSTYSAGYWLVDLMYETPGRDNWYDVTIYNITDAPAEFTFSIGLLILADDGDSFELNPGGDYDDDGAIDGDHTRVFKVQIDDVSLVSQTPPTQEEVDLRFHTGEYNTTITGSGENYTSILENQYWDDSFLTVGVSANVSVSFDYEVWLLQHFFSNSSWTTHPTEKGVTYSIDVGQSADLSTFTYIGSDLTSTFENFSVYIFIPPDWDNVTVYDPFTNDVTSSCSLQTGNITIPTSLLTRLGWWKIDFESPNYAKDIITQRYDTGLEQWSNETLFRSGNITRTQIEIGTDTSTAVISTPANITWILPNNTIWVDESISNSTGDIANSSAWTLGGTNTSAGLWEVQIFWNNGTELAYGFDTFDLYHQASASVQYPTIETDHGLVIANQIIFTDIDTGEYLLDDSISITANWSETTITFSPNYAKNWWQADFDTSLIQNGNFTVIVDISRPYFDPITTEFTVISIFETSMDILNAGSIPIENGLNEIFTVQLGYELLNGTGVGGALLTITHTVPQNGLSGQNFTDIGNGLYSLDVVCNTSDTYEITIILAKPYHYNTSDSFILIIGETGSELELLNGTADIALFEDSYRLVVEYRNSTGHGLSDADLQIITITPATGLANGSFTPMGDGLYEINFTSSSAGTFSIVISASIVNHESQYTTFTLTVSGIPTILTSIPSTKTVAVNQSFTLQVRFWDESLNPIDSAIITVISPPTGITISTALWVGDGLYNITLQSSDISTFDLLFRATADNYQSSSAGFTFVVTEIQTTLSFEDDVTSTVVEFAEPFELIVYYNGSNPVEAVQGANITVLPAVADLDIHVVEYTGYYIVTITGDGVGSWALTIVANKTDHRVATKSFFIEVEEIDTTVQGSSPLETLFIDHSYDFTFSFIFESNSSYIPGATISPFGDGADWVTFVELGSGQYSVNLTPQELGEHSVILTFERIGFESASFRLTFNVDRIPITVEVIQGISAPEYSESILTIRVIETDSGNPVSGIQVFCYIIDPNGAPSGSIAMSETGTEGIYSTTISMPIAEGQYQLQITCDGVNHVMNTEFSVNLEPERDFTTMLWVTTTQYYPIILLFAALGFGLVYRKSARKKRIRENKETLAIKKRFDDIRSLMGVIVLHKDSGLPVYSKILRDGLEETVISAFITAITSFRGEFDIESSSEEWGLIPISDIVRVISTSKLVCAFITTGNPSPEQRERMIRFAKTVAFIFDETMEDVPIVVLDHHTTQQFNALFEDILDGQLLRTFKLDDAKKLPTTSCANERIARRHGDEFKLEELATEIASCGLEEGRVYKAIMVALENHFLVTTDDSPFATELLRAPDIVEEES